MTLKGVVQYVLANLTIGMFGLLWAAVLIGFKWIDAMTGVSPQHAATWVFIVALLVGETIGFDVFLMGIRHLPANLLVTAGFMYGAHEYIADTGKFITLAPYLLMAVFISSLISYLLRDIYGAKEAAE